MKEGIQEHAPSASLVRLLDMAVALTQAGPPPHGHGHASLKQAQHGTPDRGGVGAFGLGFGPSGGSPAPRSSAASSSGYSTPPRSSASSPSSTHSPARGRILRSPSGKLADLEAITRSQVLHCAVSAAALVLALVAPRW